VPQAARLRKIAKFCAESTPPILDAADASATVGEISDPITGRVLGVSIGIRAES